MTAVPDPTVTDRARRKQRRRAETNTLTLVILASLAVFGDFSWKGWAALGVLALLQVAAEIGNLADAVRSAAGRWNSDG